METKKSKRIGLGLIILGIVITLLTILNYIFSWFQSGDVFDNFLTSTRILQAGIIIFLIGVAIKIKKTTKIFDTDRNLERKFFGNQNINIKFSLAIFVIFEIFFTWLIINANCGGACPNDFSFFLHQFLKSTFISLIATLILYIAITIKTIGWKK